MGREVTGSTVHLTAWVVAWVSLLATLGFVTLSWQSWKPSGAPPLEGYFPAATWLLLYLAALALFASLLIVLAQGDRNPTAPSWATGTCRDRQSQPHMKSEPRPLAGPRSGGALWPLPAGSILAMAFLWVVLPHVRRYFFVVDDFALAGQSQQTLASIVLTPLFGFYRPLGFVAARLEHIWFGWELPHGYAAVSLSLHIANAVGVAWIARGIRFSRAGQILSGVAFLLSPWAAEGYLWWSASFDLLATSGLLASLISGLAAIRTRSRAWCAGWMLIGGVSAALAAFSKEQAVLAPAQFFLLALLATRGSRAWLRAGTYFAVLAAVALAYIGVRASVLSALGGEYGDLFSLFETANVGSNLGHALFALAVTPLAYEEAIRASSLVLLVQLPVLLVALPVAGLLAMRRHPWTTAALLFLLCVTLVPVLWYELFATALAPRRFLYTPGIWWSLWLGLALAELLPMAPVKALSKMRLAGATVAVLLCGGYWLASVDHQVRLWREAMRLSRAVVIQFERELLREPEPLYLTNLPFMFDTGPYILVPYAFRHYYANRHVPTLAVRRAYFTYGNGKVYLLHHDPVPPDVVTDPRMYRRVTFRLPSVQPPSH